VLGALGCVCGTAGGLLLARTLVQLVSRTINDLYFQVAVNQLSVPPGLLPLAAATGVGVALLATLPPALEATAGAPRLALARSVLEQRAARVAAALLPAGIACALAAVAVIALSGRSLLAGFGALYQLLAAVTALTPPVLQGMTRLAARVVARGSPLARLAARDVGASLSRTGVAVAALAMALTAMIGVAIMVASFRESLRVWLAQTLRADVYVSAPGPAAGSERRLDPQVVAALSTARRANLSAAVNEGLRVLAALDIQRLVVEEWEREHGTFTEHELAPHLEVVTRAQIDHLKRIVRDIGHAEPAVSG
jgi:putative ABC transport system permease protein